MHSVCPNLNYPGIGQRLEPSLKLIALGLEIAGTMIGTGLVQSPRRYPTPHAARFLEHNHAIARSNQLPRTSEPSDSCPNYRDVTIQHEVNPLLAYHFNCLIVRCVDAV
jgi:hypothetical protein